MLEIGLNVWNFPVVAFSRLNFYLVFLFQNKAQMASLTKCNNSVKWNLW